LKNSFFAPISHGHYIYKTNHTATEQKRWMVKGLSTLPRLPSSRPQTLTDERPVRGQTLPEEELHENRRRTTQEQREGRSENRKDLVCLRHYDPRTEVWRGDTPKVRKL
jgi:hypothetical protein